MKSNDLLLTYILLMTFRNFKKMLNVYFTFLVDRDPSKVIVSGQLIEFFQFGGNGSRGGLRGRGIRIRSQI